MGPIQAEYKPGNGMFSLQKPERRPVARVVCWNCKRGNRTLFRIKDEQGRKTFDYVCSTCRHLVGLPPVGNQSLNRFEYIKDEETGRVSLMQ